jgi:hypothetical protein
MSSDLQLRHPHTEVGLAEVLQVCVALGVQEGHLTKWLAGSLGLFWRPTAISGQAIHEPVKPPAQTPTTAPARPETPETATDFEQKKLNLLKPVSRDPSTFEMALGNELEQIKKAKEIRPAAYRAHEVRPAFQPLLLERWFQGIFTTMLATPATTPEIDFRKLEVCLIRGDAFAQLPLKTRRNLRKGVHILLDRSESMQPFWRDQAELVARLRRMLGTPLIRETSFEFDPLRPVEDRLQWCMPMPCQFPEGTPLLLVTDFGGGQNPSAARGMDWEPWQPLLELARRHRCRVFALVANTAEFFPAELNRFLDGALEWDRQTSPNIAAQKCPR